ncbi:TetR family transcriptional regulator [Nocardia tenerifensis]|uniref:TetR family transcriptional regulator n=1 Tax=Nocardia tenerifensis TaxID=228006 RepID=A0A318JYE0_9NOCA|nr:TetR/AcrR family transcriptional regulator C-terminal domain-containing protein [Nocardia tenerifensis]PXX61789.1 TetR family transcriptional regulator [Nocardia tenerifensis]
MGDAATSGTSAAGSTRSVWLRPMPTGRNAPPLTRERIVEAAIALLDEEGLERLTMRRLAERLGTGSTTLYWHLDTKDDVIDLAVDAIFAETPIPEHHTDDWRDDIVTLLTNWRATLLRHPWTAALAANRRPMLGPNFLAWMEFLQSALVRAGITDGHVSAATWVLISHVAGNAASRSSRRFSAEDYRASQELLAEHQDRYPVLVGHGYPMDNDWDANFEKGLVYILDGLTAHTAERAK